VRVLHEVEDVPGYNVELTLDRDVQLAAFEAMQGKDGAIVALDVNSGAVLAMVSTPAFDPNVFARGVTSEEWRGLMNDRAHPLNNRAIQGQYPPGSTFKIVLSIAALEEAAIQPDTRLACGGFRQPGLSRLEKRGARLGRSAPQPGGIVRCLLLPDRPAARGR